MGLHRRTFRADREATAHQLRVLGAPDQTGCYDDEHMVTNFRRIAPLGGTRFLTAAFVALSVLACGDDTDGSGPASTSTGGSTSMTGGASSGGASNIGGYLATGGSADAGGVTARGGSPSVGGSSSIGGAVGTGGADARGGSVGIGGSIARGGSTGTGGSTANGGRIGTGGSTTTAGSSGTCKDDCPLGTGLSLECKKRFALGINYAWHEFASDFGGIAAWNKKSISQSLSTYSAEMAQMAQNGVSVIRWWMFPDFRGDGIVFDASGNPTGISATVKADITQALELAEANDLYLVLTIFSFDNFRPDRVDSGIDIRGMAPMVKNATRRATLINNIVRPVAKAAAASPRANRLLGWDVINEPEWAIAAAGNAPGGQDFSPNSELTAVTLTEMKALINESIAALREETPKAQTSVGWAAAKWSWAFQDVNVDFHQPHIYAWVNKYWPYTTTPDKLGYPAGKPVVMGEYFLTQMPFETSDTYDQIMTSWWSNGYAGAWSWQFIENQSSLGLIKAFADKKGCQAGF